MLNVKVPPMAQRKDTDAQEADGAREEYGSKDVIEDAKGYLRLCIAANDRSEQLDDLRFLSGEQWPVEVERARELDKRPCLTINKLPTFLHQVTNNQRMNVPSIKVSPVNNGNMKTAEVIQGVVRHAEYSSNADIAYDTAVNSAAAIGEGYFRLVTDYCRPDSFDQDIKFKRIRNPFTVYFDPTSEEPDGSDQKRCLISERIPRADFEAQYPNASATTQGFNTGIGDPTNKDWLGADFIRVAEFYRIEYTDDKLVELSNGETGFKSKLLELPPGVTIVRDRPTQRPTVMWYKLTALEVIESTEIKCRWIPVFPVHGDEIDLDGKVIRSGIVRHAKDPAQMYNYWMTAATEEVAMRPKTPYIGAEGQFEGYEDDWNSANVRNFSYLEYKPVELNGSLAPPPQRQPMADMPQGVLTMAMHANDNIKATTGLFDSSLGARGTARSGVQEKEQQRQGDMANFHYSDNLDRSVRHAGRCFIDMFPHYYDAARVVRIMGDDGKISSVAINTPEPEVDPETGQPKRDENGEIVQKILHDTTVGEYDVVVKAGPSYDTLREEAADSMIEMQGKWPKLMDIAGDKVVRSMDWPGADEIADRIKKTIPPELTADEEGGEDQDVIQTPQGPIPVEQVPALLAQLQGQLQEMGAALQEAQSGIDKAKVDAEAKIATAETNAQAAIQKAQMDADTKVRVAEIQAVSAGDVAELNGLIKLLVAKMTPPPGLEGDSTTKPSTSSSSELSA